MNYKMKLTYLKHMKNHDPDSNITSQINTIIRFAFILHIYETKKKKKFKANNNQ